METKQAQARAAREQKPPAAYSKKGAARADTKKAAKEDKPVSIGAIFSVLLVLIIVSVLALIYFDLLGVKDFAVSALQLDAPTNNYLKQLLHIEEELLDVRIEMEDREKAVQNKENELNKREKSIVTMEEELASRQEALNQMQQLVEGLSTDIGSIASMVQNMDPQKAADALGMLYDTSSIAKILAAMEYAQAAEILNCMATERAALVFAEMLRYTR